MTMADLTLPRSARRVAIALAAAILLVWPGATRAQTYPSKVVKIVVPFPGGGPLDLMTRLLADKLGASLKQPFIVDNRPGAAGNIGTEAVTKSPPYLYTLLSTLNTPLTLTPHPHHTLPSH